MRFFAFIGLLTPVVLGSFVDTDLGKRIVGHIEKFGSDLTDVHGRINEEVFDSWSKEDLEAWLDSHKVQADDKLAAAKEHRDLLLQDLADKKDSFAASASVAGEHILEKGKEFYESLADSVVELWSDSKLIEYIHERGIKEPAHYTHDQLVKLAKQAKELLPEMPNGHFGRNWFSSWSREDLVATLKKTGDSIEGSRKDLIDRVYKVYTDAFNKGTKAGEKAHDKIQKDGQAINRELQGHLMQWKEAAFDKWSLEDLKEYVSDFSDEVSAKQDELVAQAKAHHAYYTWKLRPKNIHARVKRPHACHQLVSHTKAQWLNVAPYIMPVYNSLRDKVLGIYNFVRSKL